MKLNNIKFFIKSLNILSVIFALGTMIVSGFFLNRDLLAPANIETRLILYSLSLAGATNLVEFMLRKVESPSKQAILFSIISGFFVFVLMIIISLLYLKKDAP